MKRLTTFILILFVSVGLYAQKKKLSKNKKALIASVEKHKKELIRISDEIWRLAETAFEVLDDVTKTIKESL